METHIHALLTKYASFGSFRPPDEPTLKVASDQLGLIHKQREGTNVCADVLPTNM